MAGRRTRALRPHRRAASRIELVVARGCVSKCAAAYALGVLERKGYLVRVYNVSGRLRYMPAERETGTNAKAGAMTAEQVIDWLREADDQTLSRIRTEIEAEVIRRG